MPQNAYSLIGDSLMTGAQMGRAMGFGGEDDGATKYKIDRENFVAETEGYIGRLAPLQSALMTSLQSRGMLDDDVNKDIIRATGRDFNQANTAERAALGRAYLTGRVRDFEQAYKGDIAKYPTANKSIGDAYKKIAQEWTPEITTTIPESNSPVRKVQVKIGGDTGGATFEEQWKMQYDPEAKREVMMPLNKDAATIPFLHVYDPTTVAALAYAMVPQSGGSYGGDTEAYEQRTSEATKFVSNSLPRTAEEIQLRERNKITQIFNDVGATENFFDPKNSKSAFVLDAEIGEVFKDPNNPHYKYLKAQLQDKFAERLVADNKVTRLLADTVNQNMQMFYDLTVDPKTNHLAAYALLNVTDNLSPEDASEYVKALQRINGSLGTAEEISARVFGPNQPLEGAVAPTVLDEAGRQRLIRENGSMVQSLLQDAMMKTRNRIENFSKHADKMPNTFSNKEEKAAMFKILDGQLLTLTNLSETLDKTVAAAIAQNDTAINALQQETVAKDLEAQSKSLSAQTAITVKRNNPGLVQQAEQGKLFEQVGKGLIAEQMVASLNRTLDPTTPGRDVFNLLGTLKSYERLNFVGTADEATMIERDNVVQQLNAHASDVQRSIHEAETTLRGFNNTGVPEQDRLGTNKAFAQLAVGYISMYKMYKAQQVTGREISPSLASLGNTILTPKVLKFLESSEGQRVMSQVDAYLNLPAQTQTDRAILGRSAVMGSTALFKQQYAWAREYFSAPESKGLWDSAVESGKYFADQTSTILSQMGALLRDSINGEGK